MNPEDYVSYPLALALKKHGFDWECDHYYCAFDNETDVRFWSIHPAQSQNGLRLPKDTEVADAPTLAQAQKWLREEKNHHVNSSCINKDTWYYTVEELTDNVVVVRNELEFSSYEEALSTGIESALELIKKKGERYGMY